MPAPKDEKGLTHIQNKIIAYWPESKSIVDVARKVGCDRQTVYNALQNSAFKNELSHRQKEFTDIMREMFSRGLKKVDDIMMDPESTKEQVMKAFEQVKDTSKWLNMELKEAKSYDHLSDQALQDEYSRISGELDEYEQEQDK